MYACRVYTVLFILWPWYGNLFCGPGKVLVLTKKSYLHDEIASLDQTTSIRTLNCYHLCTWLLLVYVMFRCCSRSDLAGDLPVIISHIHTCDWVRICHTCLWLTDFSSTCPVVPWVCPAFIHVNILLCVLFTGVDLFVRCVGQGQSGQAVKLFHITPYVNDFQTLNNPCSWQPVGASKY